MPNYVKREQETLSDAQLHLAEQSRQPQLGALDDSALLALIAALREARLAAQTSERAGEMLNAALRRANTERRKRGLPTTSAAASRSEAARPVAGPAMVAVSGKPATARRKPATLPRTPAGRKPAEARKTDLRTEPHRVPKRRAKPAPDPEPSTPDPVTRPAVIAEDKAQKAAKQSGRKAEKVVKTAAEKETAKAARKAQKKAAKQAEKKAAKAARQAEKDAAKEARRAARKAEKQAEKAPAGGKTEKPGKARKAKAAAGEGAAQEAGNKYPKAASGKTGTGKAGSKSAAANSGRGEAEAAKPATDKASVSKKAE